MIDRTDEGRGSGSTLGRREFLLAGSACLLTLAVGAGDAQAETTDLHVGYWPGPAVSSDDERAPFRPDVAAANRIGAGDRSLAKSSAIVTVHGLVGDPHAASVTLNAHFTVEHQGVRRALPFHAWSYRREVHRQASPPVRFALPVDPVQGISLTVETGSAGPGWDGSETKSLGIPLAGSSGQPALRPGTYLIALAGPVATGAPRWEHYQFRSFRPGSPISGRRLCRLGIQGIEEVRFPYVVVSIDRPSTAG